MSCLLLVYMYRINVYTGGSTGYIFGLLIFAVAFCVEVSKGCANACVMPTCKNAR